MNKKRIASFLCSCMCLFMAFSKNYSGPVTRLLHEGWEFSQGGSNEWLSAKVPGTVHQALLEHQRIPDPFFGKNEEKIQWVENEEWVYRVSFQVDEAELQRGAASLVFEGLDTYADVYLNGALLLKSDNMFVGYNVPVKSVLRKGENKLAVRFRSPIKETLYQWETNGFNYPADNDHHEKRMSVFTRKAPYSYGWDWGIRLVTSGIWRPVKLVFYDVASIDDFFVQQKSVTAQKAQIENHLEVSNVTGTAQHAELKISYGYGDKMDVLKKEFMLQPGSNVLNLPLEISNPHLWMPNGWGEPFLYDFVASVSVDGAEVARKEEKIGLRSIQVVMEDDKDGKSFYFVVNGKPLFIKGTNMIPEDALLPRVTPERYEQLVEDARVSNMNMIRVWGGGIYEDDAFYKAADRKGILVWQDFLFACTSYPYDPTFLNRVSEESEYNIKRLRNHASLAMWCGNNEIYEGMRFWAWHRRFTPEVYQSMKEGYEVLFHQLLPEKVKMYDPERFYMHGSPYESNWGRPKSMTIADSHNWGTWYGQKPFETLDTEIPRFMSEFGFQSVPEMKTIRTFASEKDYALESDVMNAHQKSTIGNFLIKKTMALYYKVPEKFEDLIYAGLVLQGQGIRKGLEAHRRNRPYCMGTMPWQFNDSWPVVSWSAIDYFGNWKAMQYQTQRGFAPVLVDAVREGDNLCYYLMSDKLEGVDVVLDMKFMNFDGKVFRKIRKKGYLPANTSIKFYEETLKEALAGKDEATSLVHMVLKDGHGKVLSDAIYYFAYPKDQLLPNTPLKYKVKNKDGVCEVTVSAEKLARDVFIEVPVQGVRFTDNFFDLLPGQKKTVRITSPEGYSLENMEVKIRQLSDIQ